LLISVVRPSPRPHDVDQMKRNLGRLFFFTAVLFVVIGGSSRAAENEGRILASSPSGNLRVQQRGEEYWVVSNKDPKQVARIPLEPGEETAPVEVYFSPNDAWLFTLPNGMSCRREGSLFRRDAGMGRIESVESFNDKAWAQGWKLVGFEQNSSAQGACAMMRFIGWSQDSARLLLALRGGSGKFEMDGAYLYFHTASNRFEVTSYLRRLNKITSDIISGEDDVLPCAELAEALAGEAELRARLEKLDTRLNTRYAELMKTLAKKDAEALRREQRDWLKDRDAGLKVYLSLVTPAERERRRLQYLGDVTAMRLALPAARWSTSETWMY
jgi:lysozyme inhibitor LprI